ncbi:uncharacterized protein [Blastocystis hominis]|uniref:Protein kinase domain-containing protein n=1 Tax=Blastocystis hominis TaxID=12968 RepID=D8LZ19_BLAHO|nr:uncharacterized protein [Blastocystis hominis]CBK21058.2 unnamed protein product [Blastocystis hominis]|eukprot:XP_012895106.1 uncharacterized protein [Blastocystis hominis]
MFTIHNLQPDVIEETATLGLGSNATVMLGRYDNRDVALKIYKSNDYATKVEALNEVSIYSRLKNQPHVVNCYGMYYRNGAPVLVLEKAQKSLYNVYREERVSRAQYNWPAIKDRAMQISFGLKSLHDINISHGDVSSKNFLQFEDNVLKISDMGYAQVIENGFFYDPSCRCSLYAAAPDFLLTSKRSLSTDIYSLGMVFLELVKGGFAYTQQDLECFMVNNVMDTNTFVQHILYGQRPSIPSEVPDYFADIIRWCWIRETERKKRPTIDQVIERLEAWDVD